MFFILQQRETLHLCKPITLMYNCYGIRHECSDVLHLQEEPFFLIGFSSEGQDKHNFGWKTNYFPLRITSTFNKSGLLLYLPEQFHLFFIFHTFKDVFFLKLGLKTVKKAIVCLKMLCACFFFGKSKPLKDRTFSSSGRLLNFLVDNTRRLCVSRSGCFLLNFSKFASK